jgi:hypothetical protein
LRIPSDEIDPPHDLDQEDRVKSRVWVLSAAGIGIAALCLIYSQQIHLVLDPIWSALSANRHPPQIVAGYLSDDDWRDRSNASRKFTALLQQKFPAGTDEPLLRSQLAAEGFKSPPPGVSECQQPTQIEPIGTVSITCSYRANVLEYHWSVGFVCGMSLHVKWSTNDHIDITGVRRPPRITRVVGEYYAACL